jgi:hypothetical protein
MASEVTSHVHHAMDEDAKARVSSCELDTVVWKRIIKCGFESLKYIVAHFHPECKETEYHQHFSEQGENLLFLYASALRIMQQCAALAELMYTDEYSGNDGNQLLAIQLCGTYEEAFTGLQSMMTRWSSELLNVHFKSPSVAVASAFATNEAEPPVVTAEPDNGTRQQHVCQHDATHNALYPTSTTWFVRHWFPDLEHFTPHGVFAAAYTKDQAHRIDSHDPYDKALLDRFAAANDWNNVIDVAVGEWISTTDLANRKTVIEDCLSVIQTYIPKIRVVYCQETGHMDHVMWILFLTHVVFMITQYGVQWKTDMDQFDVYVETVEKRTDPSGQINDNGELNADIEKVCSSSKGVLTVLRAYLYTECFCQVVAHINSHPRNKTVNKKDLCNEIALSLLLLLTLDGDEEDIDTNHIHQRVENQIIKYITEHVICESGGGVAKLLTTRKRRHGNISNTESSAVQQIASLHCQSLKSSVYANVETSSQKADYIFTKCHEHYSQAALLFGFLRRHLLGKYYSRCIIPRRNDKRTLMSGLIPVLYKSTFPDVRDFERHVQSFLRYHGCVHIRHAFSPNAREQTWGREIPRILALTDDVMLRLKTTLLGPSALPDDGAVCPVETGNNSFTTAHASDTLTELGIVRSVQEFTDKQGAEHCQGLNFSSILRTCGVVSAAQPASALRIVSDEVYLRCKKNGFSVAHADYFAYKENGKLFGPHLNKLRISALHSVASAHAPCTKDGDGVDSSSGLCGNIPGQTISEMQSSDHGDDDVCRVCNKADAQENMVICDICEGSFHMNCATLPICDITAATEWHCSTCVQSDLPVYTAWIPLQELHAEKDSILAIVPRSHLCAGFDDPISAQLSLPSAFLTHTPECSKIRCYDTASATSMKSSSNGSARAPASKLAWWIPDKVEFGDLIIFNTKSIHGATANVSSRIRCSLDIRFVIDSTEQSQNFA